LKVAAENSELQARKSKFEARNSDSSEVRVERRNLPAPHRDPSREVRISSFKFRVSRFRALSILLAAYCLLFLPACGYHVAGTATRVPADVKTIAVPAFKNESLTFRIEQQLTSAVTHEFLERTHYRILPDLADADAVLRGTVKDVRARAITFDINTGRATSLQVQVTADVKLEDLHTHKILFSNSNYVFREEYQESESPAALFQEDQAALERLSHDLARTLVTDILENF
jgi:outer membrane lipopolysaccharide assembly protein LptE/RlpB